MSAAAQPPNGAPPAPKRRRAQAAAPTGLSALAVLEVAAGGGCPEAVVEKLVAGVVRDPAVAEEAWTIIAERGGGGQSAAACAVAHKTAAARARFAVRPPAPAVGGGALGRLHRLVRAVARQSALGSFGDEYQATMLRLMLPSKTTVFSIGRAPYRAAAAFWAEQTNHMVRPLINTPLRDILGVEPAGDRDEAWLCAAVVVLKELTNGAPRVHIGPAVTEAAVGVPSIAVDRACFGTDRAWGIIQPGPEGGRETFTPTDHPLCDWLAAALDCPLLPGVQQVARLVLHGPTGGALDRYLKDDDAPPQGDGGAAR